VFTDEKEMPKVIIGLLLNILRICRGDGVSKGRRVRAQPRLLPAWNSGRRHKQSRHA
jgi:hypothetical protein